MTVMSDEQAVAEVLVRYGFAMDSRRFDDVAALLTDDATFSLAIAGVAQPPPPVSGAQAVADWIGSTISTHDHQLRHVLSNFRFERRSEGRIAVSAYLTLFTTTAAGGLELTTTAVYDCEAAATDGTWRLARIHVAFDRPF